MTHDKTVVNAYSYDWKTNEGFIFTKNYKQWLNFSSIVVIELGMRKMKERTKLKLSCMLAFSQLLYELAELMGPFLPWNGKGFLSVSILSHFVVVITEVFPQSLPAWWGTCWSLLTKKVCMITKLIASLVCFVNTNILQLIAVIITQTQSSEKPAA